ncbi:MAG: DNA polymerase I [Candidatus Omnitrophota bacterium]
MQTDRTSQRLLLIDATAYCYRAFYALRGLSTSFGQPTNAIYGFVNFFNKILKQENPEYLGACFDVSRDTFRQREFAKYKIQRPPMPDDLAGQIPIIKQIIRAYGIAMYEKAGFEADDLLATLTRKARKAGMDVVIISSDKDILQLVDENVKVFSPYKDKKGTLYNSKRVREQFGIEPSQMIDFISLTGDPADNIPPVKGIGEKTAARLIRDYKSIEGILDNLEKIKPQRLQEALKESSQQIMLNRSLIKLREDVELDFDLGKLKLGEPDYFVLRNIFRQLEFRSLLENLPQSSSAGAVEGAESARESADASTIKKIVSDGGKELVLTHRDDRLAIFAAEKKIFAEFNDRDLNDDVLSILSNPGIKKIGHNLKELKVKLAKRKIRLDGLYFDTMIAAYLLNPSGADYALSEAVWDYFKEAVDVRSLRPDTACGFILRLKSVLEKELREKELDSLFFNLEMPLIDVLGEMELAGVAVDLELLESLSRQIERQLIGLVEKIYELSGTQFNINSPKQLRSILFERLKLPVQKKTKSGPSTDEEVLNRLAGQHPLPGVLLEYRKLTKIKSTYVDAFPALVDPETKRIHASFNQTGTQTGRLSSANPNLQNLPIKGDIGRQIRKAIIVSGENNLLASFDYSQIELRLLAHLSGDSQLIDAFNNDRDIHIATASLIYGLGHKDIDDKMREVAKRINFGIIYGLSSYGLSRDLGITQEEAGNFIDAYFSRYPGVKDYIVSQIQRARQDGYVTTILGRRRYISGIDSNNAGMRQFAERQAINTPVQGSAADLIKKAMVDISCEIRKSGLKSKLILQIHDELVFEVPAPESDELIKLVRRQMEGCVKFNVPIRAVAKVGKNWLEMEEVR